MGKLHQVLAVEDSKLVLFKKIVEEGKSTLSTKDHLFTGRTIRQESILDENDPKKKEFPDATEVIPVAENVESKLEYIFEAAIQYFDLVAEKDEANTKARADLVIDNVKVLENVPAVTLLFIENRFKIVRDLLESIKTLDQAKNWEPDKNQPGVFMSPETFKIVKEDVEDYRTVAPATDKHPAQVVKIINKEIRATKYTVEKSGLVFSARKSQLMMRCDQIIIAAKKARQVANDTEVTPVYVSKKLFDYLLSK